jgi:hypothetical protein
VSQYFIVVEQQQRGPFTLEQLAQQPLTPQTLAWREGMAAWLPAAQITELQRLLAPKPSPTRAAAAHQYHALIDGQQRGPFTAAQLAQQPISAQTLVWREGLPAWVSAGQIPELQGLLPGSAGQMPPAPRAYAPLPYASPMAPGQVSHILTSFSTPLAIVLHFLTCGLFTLIHFGLMHDALPRVRQDDPSAGKAIGFMFIPFFNIYWVFFAYLRLIDRVNEQRAWAGLPPTEIKGLFITAMVCCLIPWVNIIAAFVLQPIWMGMLRASVNELVAVTRPGF